MAHLCTAIYIYIYIYSISSSNRPSCRIISLRYVYAAASYPINLTRRAFPIHILSVTQFSGQLPQPPPPTQSVALYHRCSCPPGSTWRPRRRVQRVRAERPRLVSSCKYTHYTTDVAAASADRRDAATDERMHPQLRLPINGDRYVRDTALNGAGAFLDVSKIEQQMRLREPFALYGGCCCRNRSRSDAAHQETNRPSMLGSTTGQSYVRGRPTVRREGVQKAVNRTEDTDNIFFPLIGM